MNGLKVEVSNDQGPAKSQPKTPKSEITKSKNRLRPVWSAPIKYQLDTLNVKTAPKLIGKTSNKEKISSWNGHYLKITGRGA